MQPGGFGGQGPGQPPGGYPPGGAPPYGNPHGAPQNPQAPQYQGAPQQAHQQPGMPHQPQAPQYGGPPQQYGTPPQHGALPQQYGAPQAYGAPPQQYAPQAYGAPPQVPQMGAMPNMAALPGMGAAQNSFAQAQGALAGAGSMMKLMKYGFIGIGALCVLGGVVLLFAVDVMTGVMVAITGAVFIGVAIAVLPMFSGMVGQASAMVDSFAAKEQLALTGVPAQGRLLSVQQTGRLVNYNPEIQALVEVTHPQLGVYQVQTTAIVPQIAIPRAQPGAPVQVRVSPQNQNEIALVF